MNLLEAEARVKIIDKKISLIKESIKRELLSGKSSSMERFKDIIDACNLAFEDKTNLESAIEQTLAFTQLDGVSIIEKQNRIKQSYEKLSLFKDVYMDSLNYYDFNDSGKTYIKPMMDSITEYLSKADLDILKAELEIIEVKSKVELREQNG